MLVSINLLNFILVDSAAANFEQGLNIITGETGAGKTLFIQAIGLLLGQKVSSNLIRNGKETAVVEALFDITNIPSIHRLLSEKGIDIECSDDLIVKRIISSKNKNRIFINGQMVPLAFLEEIGHMLVQVVSQNSANLLRKAHVQREMLDLFGGITSEVQKLKASYQCKQDLKRTLEAQKQELSEKELYIDRIGEELEEWTHFNFRSGEGEELFDRYSQSLQSEEVKKKLYLIEQGLSEETSALIPNLLQSKKELNGLSSPKRDYSRIVEKIHTAIINLQETSFLINETLNTFEQEPSNLKEIDDRLTHLNDLKKKYRVEEKEIPDRIKKLKQELDRYEKLKDMIVENETRYITQKENAITLAKTITLKRKNAAHLLKEKLKAELKELNFNDLEVSISLKSKELGPYGADEILFCFSPNKGEPLALVGEKSSGGEISRFLLALKLCLADKEKIPTLIFDEIDSNVGGKTATCIGKKLKHLGTSHQILCITHFPQVATCADHHLCISKNRVDNRTETCITVLTTEEKDKELVRMLGGEVPSLAKL